MELKIRNAVSSDLGCLRDIYRRSSLSNNGHREELLANPEALQFSSRPVKEGRTRVATEDGTILGLAVYRLSGDSMELDELFVDPDWMGRGVGRTLILDLIGVAETGGYDRIDVTSAREALGFYEKSGFVVTRTVSTMFGPAPRMFLDLVA